MSWRSSCVLDKCIVKEHNELFRIGIGVPVQLLRFHWIVVLESWAWAYLHRDLSWVLSLCRKSPEDMVSLSKPGRHPLTGNTSEYRIA